MTRGLTDAGISLKTLDLVFITHLHSDHVLELGAADPHRLDGGSGDAGHGVRPARHQPLLAATFCQAMDFDIEIRIADEGRPDIRDLVSITEFGEGRCIDEGGLSVSALRVDHPPVTECYALRFEHGGQSVVFSADTAFFPATGRFCQRRRHPRP